MALTKRIILIVVIAYVLMLLVYRLVIQITP
jgi:hypothetical protein